MTGPPTPLARSTASWARTTRWAPWAATTSIGAPPACRRCSVLTVHGTDTRPFWVRSMSHVAEHVPDAQTHGITSAGHAAAHPSRGPGDGTPRVLQADNPTAGPLAHAAATSARRGTGAPGRRTGVWESAGMAEQTPDAAGPPPVDVTRLTNEAGGKSGLLWVRLPGGDAYPVWHAWHDPGGDRSPGPSAYVISGPGEQYLPWLPDEVEVVLRSKDTGGRLLTLHATARELEPGSEEWVAAVDVLRPERLNAPGDVTDRWRDTCTVHAITPHGRPVESPGHYAESSGAAPVRPAPATTARWRPWHWRGRAGARRNTAR